MITSLLWYPDSAAGRGQNNKEWEEFIAWPLVVGWRLSFNTTEHTPYGRPFQYVLTIDDVRTMHSGDPFIGAWFSVEPEDRPSEDDMEMLSLLAEVYYSQRRNTK